MARWLAGTGTVLRTPSLSWVAAAVEIVCWRKFESPCFAFCRLRLAVWDAFSFAIRMLSFSTVYADFVLALGFGFGSGGVGACGLGSVSGGGDEVGRLNLPLAIMSFQLVVLPLDSFIARSPAALAASIENSQYC